MAETTVEILIRAQENVSQAVNQVKQQLEGLSQHAQSVFGRLTQFFRQNEEALNSLAKVGAVVSGTFTALAVAGARHANQLREEALQIGTTVEKYSVYRAMLQDLEIHAEMIPFFIMRMQVAFQNAAAAVAEKGNKVSELTALLAVLGQTVQSQTNDPLEQFVSLLKEIAKIPDQAQQAQILFELFGRRAYTLLPILREGAHELDNLIQKYRELGVTVSDEVANKIDQMTDALSTLKVAVQALLSEGLANVAPTLEKIAEGINKVVAAVKAFGESHPTLASFISHLLAMVAILGMLATLFGAVGHGVKWVGEGLKALGALKVTDGIKALVGWLSKLWDILKLIGSGITAVVSPIILGIGAIAIGIAGLIRWIDEKTGKISDWLAKLMLPKEQRHLVDEFARDRREAEAWERQQKAKQARAETRETRRETRRGWADWLRDFMSGKTPEDIMKQVTDRGWGEKDEWAAWREHMLKSQQNMEQRWSDYINNLQKQWQEWFNYRKQFYDDVKRKYYEWVDKQKEALERITRAEEEMRSRMAEAYASAARLAANLAARAGVYHIRYGAFGYFAIPVVQEAQPVAYTPSHEEMTLSYTAHIYYYAQQIWLSIQNIVGLLQMAVGYLSTIADATTKAAKGATLTVNVPFGYDQIRSAISDAVNEALGNKLAYELLRNG
jgi:ABC-type transporter Mla subunit MlaD